MHREKSTVIAYYNQEATRYADLYQRELLAQEFYPANAVRLEIIIDRLKARRAKRVIDVGCGSGQPLLRMLREGFDAVGFDFSPSMVEVAQKTLRDDGHDPTRVTAGDLEIDDKIPSGPFDAIVATGVFPHNLDDASAYRNIAKRLSKGSTALIEYRNALMALFSINKYSSAFFWSDLLQDGKGLSSELSRATLEFLASKFDTTQEAIGSAREIQYTDILAKFHNPLTLNDEIAPYGLRSIKNHFYHFHAAPPSLEAPFKEDFWKASLAMERHDDWRGTFLCSAFVAEIEHAAGS